MRHAAGRPSLQSRAGPQKEEDSNHEDYLKSQLCKGRADPHDLSEVAATGESLQRARTHPTHVGLAQRLALWAQQTRPASQPHCRAGAEVPEPHARPTSGGGQGRGGRGSTRQCPAPTSNWLQHPSFHFTNEETKIKREEVTKFMWQSGNGMGRSPEHATPLVPQLQESASRGGASWGPGSGGGRPDTLVP